MINDVPQATYPAKHEWLWGKKICVIGGTSGMGAAIVRACLDGGAQVWATGVSAGSIASARELFGKECRIDCVDMRDGAEISAYARQFDVLDALINCAGASFPERETDPDVFSDAVTINLTGIGRTCLAFQPSLFTSKGSVVNFASVTSFLGSATNPAYSAAKGGIVQLTKSLARMWGPAGVRVNAIAPGYVQTKMTAFRWQSESGAKAIADRIPLGRWAQPSDMVGPTLFLCSAEARYVTGAVLPVDGGFLLT